MRPVVVAWLGQDYVISRSRGVFCENYNCYRRTRGDVYARIGGLRINRSLEGALAWLEKYRKQHP